MKIKKVISHVLQYDLPEELGYSQQYYKKRSAHLIEIQTDEGIVGWGECFGPGNVAIANKTIIERVIQPLILGCDPMNREMIWHDIYNLLRDHGQKGMPIQSLSGIDIALWDIAAKKYNVPLYQLVGGQCHKDIPAYGYGMMLQPESIDTLKKRFAKDSLEIKQTGYKAIKMKIGLGPKKDIELVEAVRRSIGDDFRLMVDANHCYTTFEALYVGKAFEELGVYWFEEPIAPEDIDGYRELRSKLNINITGGEAEFSRWGWRKLLEERCLDIAQPEVCAVGGISEYLKILALAHTHFTPVVNHVWGSSIAVAVNMHLLMAMPPIPGGLHSFEPMLEYDTTHNLFHDELFLTPLNIKHQVQSNNGRVKILNRAGHGMEPNPEKLKQYEIS